VTTFTKAIQSNEEVQYEAYVDHLRHAKFACLRQDKDTRHGRQRESGTCPFRSLGLDKIGVFQGSRRMHLIPLAVRLVLAGLFLIAGGSKLLVGLANSRKSLADFG
jgi:hypothetical protein